MARITRYPLPWTTVFAKANTPVFLPATPWMEASRVDKVRATIELAAREGDLECAFGYQTANVENDPQAGAAVGAYQDADDVLYPTGMTDLSGVTPGKQLIRFGFMTKNTSSTNLNRGRAGGTFDVEECGG